MLVDLNIVLNNTFEDDIEVQRGTPSYREQNNFLNGVIIPIYKVLKSVRFLCFFSINVISVNVFLKGYVFVR